MNINSQAATLRNSFSQQDQAPVVNNQAEEQVPRESTGNNATYESVGELPQLAPAVNLAYLPLAEVNQFVESRQANLNDIGNQGTAITQTLNPQTSNEGLAASARDTQLQPNLMASERSSGRAAPNLTPLRLRSSISLHRRTQSTSPLKGRRADQNEPQSPTVELDQQNKPVTAINSNQKSEVKIERISHFLEVSAAFWDRDSHGLYDYDSPKIENGKMTIAGSTMLARNENSLTTVIPQLSCPDSFRKMMSVVYKNGAYWIYQARTLYKSDGTVDQTFSHFEQVWQIVRFANQSSDKLETIRQSRGKKVKNKTIKDCVKVGEGDIMKFGRVRFRVKKLHVTRGSKAIDPTSKTLMTINTGRKVHPTDQIMESQPSARSTQTGMGHLVRLHTTANFSIEMQPVNLSILSGFGKESQDPEHDSDDEVQMQSYNKRLSASDNFICRICLSEEELPEHELISPCKCGGSMRHIGLSCIQEWLNGKRHKKLTPAVNSYIWKQLECEICKEPFKDKFEFEDGREVSLLKYDVHEGSQNYMVIESMTYSTAKTIHVINFDHDQTVKVGRSNEAEVRITDISVSRHHSSLILNEDGTVSLTDNKSKFGTLKLVKEPMRVPQMTRNNYQAIYLQVGRAIIMLSAQKWFSWKNLCCCLGPNRDQKMKNVLHFDEARDQFPVEFSLYFHKGPWPSLPEPKPKKKAPKRVEGELSKARKVEEVSLKSVEDNQQSVEENQVQIISTVEQDYHTDRANANVVQHENMLIIPSEGVSQLEEEKVGGTEPHQVTPIQNLQTMISKGNDFNRLQEHMEEEQKIQIGSFEIQEEELKIEEIDPTNEIRGLQEQNRTNIQTRVLSVSSSQGQLENVSIQREMTKMPSQPEEENQFGRMVIRQQTEGIEQLRKSVYGSQETDLVSRQAVGQARHLQSEYPQKNVNRNGIASAITKYYEAAGTECVQSVAQPTNDDDGLRLEQSATDCGIYSVMNLRKGQGTTMSQAQSQQTLAANVGQARINFEPSVSAFEKIKGTSSQPGIKPAADMLLKTSMNFSANEEDSVALTSKPTPDTVPKKTEDLQRKQSTETSPRREATTQPEVKQSANNATPFVESEEDK